MNRLYEVIDGENVPAHGSRDMPLSGAGPTAPWMPHITSIQNTMRTGWFARASFLYWNTSTEYRFADPGKRRGASCHRQRREPCNTFAQIRNPAASPQSTEDCLSSVRCAATSDASFWLCIGGPVHQGGPGWRLARGATPCPSRVSAASCWGMERFSCMGRRGREQAAGSSISAMPATTEWPASHGTWLHRSA